MNANFNISTIKCFYSCPLAMAMSIYTFIYNKTVSFCTIALNYFRLKAKLACFTMYNKMFYLINETALRRKYNSEHLYKEFFSQMINFFPKMIYCKMSFEYRFRIYEH